MKELKMSEIKKKAKNNDERETKQFLAFIERTAKEVEGWPAWMKGKADSEVASAEMTVKASEKR